MRPPQDTDVPGILASDPTQVEAVARSVVGRSSASLRDWAITGIPGGAGGNPTSGGLFRVSGHVTDGTASLAWSAILKVVRSPVETGEPWDAPGDAIYWRREVEAFGSGLLGTVHGLVVPRCYGTLELPASTAWLWLEDLGTLQRGSWGPEEYAVAARGLAHFHAPYLRGAPIPDEPWLNRDYLRGFHQYLLPWFEPMMARARASGDGPLRRLDPRYADPPVAMVMEVVADPRPLLAVLDDMPQALCHNDTHIDNLLVRQGPDGPELVAIDWQMVGPGPIGADLGQLLCEVPESHGTISGADVEAAVLRAYQEEVSRCGAQVELTTVHLAQSTDALLRQALWLVLLLCLRLEELGPDDDEGARGVIEEFVATVGASRLPRLARQVRELLSIVRAAAPEV